jgi:hypothetical protein
MHEASHMAVYLQLGGKWNRYIEIEIQPDFGLVTLDVLHDQKHGIFLDFCVYAAGIAADRINGTSSYIGHGSDTHRVQDYAIDLRFTGAEIELVINRIEKWLRNYNDQITAAATKLIYARNCKGAVSKAKGKAIAENLKEGLRNRRKLEIRHKRRRKNK